MSLFYPQFVYCREIWGNTYKTTSQCLFILEKEVIKTITHYHTNGYLANVNGIFGKLSVSKLIYCIHNDKRHYRKWIYSLNLYFSYCIFFCVYENKRGLLLWLTIGMNYPTMLSSFLHILLTKFSLKQCFYIHMHETSIYMLCFVMSYECITIVSFE